MPTFKKGVFPVECCDNTDKRLTAVRKGSAGDNTDGGLLRLSNVSAIGGDDSVIAEFGPYCDMEGNDGALWSADEGREK